MNVLYLRADSEAALITALAFARMTGANGQGGWLTATAEYALDIIGDIYNDDGVYDTSSFLGFFPSRICVTPPTKKAGFHANLKCNDRILALVPVGVIIVPPPGHVVREWA